jgi:hypothetical protein
MRKQVLGVCVGLVLAGPAWAGCQLEEDAALGVFWDCGSSLGAFAGGGGGGAAPAAARAPAAAPVGGRDGGTPASDALGFAAATTGFGVAVFSGNIGAMAAGALGMAATGAGPMGDAANSGAVGDAAAAADGADGGASNGGE